MFFNKVVYNYCTMNRQFFIRNKYLFIFILLPASLVMMLKFTDIAAISIRDDNSDVNTLTSQDNDYTKSLEPLYDASIIILFFDAMFLLSFSSRLWISCQIFVPNDTFYKISKIRPPPVMALL